MPRPRQTARETIDRWEPIARPEGPADWFAGWESMPPYDAGAGRFSAANTWWLASLCRLSYTPDSRESQRPWHRDKPSRGAFLERSPFRETLNLHKTGNHAALYRLEGAPGAVLCFRGTNKLRQWIMNLSAVPRPWSRTGDPAVCVHQGFQILFERVWPLIEPSLIGIEGPLVLTGHSLGGAFATLAAAALPKDTVSSLATFGSPRVGNAALGAWLANRGVGTQFRVVNYRDLVTLLPLKETRLGDRDYQHVARPIILGNEPGSIHFGGLPESECDPGWLPEKPRTWLARDFCASEPPEGVLAHLPLAYERRLHDAAALIANADSRAGCV